MTLQGKIHDLWEHQAGDAFDTLRSRLPVARAVTGTWKGDDALPRATINREGGSPLARWEGGRLDVDTLRIQVWHDNFDAGAAIRDAVVAAFDDFDIRLPGKTIVCMRLANHFDLEEDDGVWQFLVDFEVQH